MRKRSPSTLTERPCPSPEPIVTHMAGSGTGGLRRRLRGLWVRRRGLRLPRPLLVEVDAPLALVVLLELQLGAEGAAGAPLESGHGLHRPPDARLLAPLARVLQRLHQLLHHRGRQVLTRLALPDHEAAARIVLRPARVALAVLDHVAAADRARAEVRPLDLHVLPLVELLDRLRRELGDVLHERGAAVLALLDQAEPPLPIAREAGRGERVGVEQPDHHHTLVGRVQRAALALDVADVYQPLDDRRARGGRADAGVLHGLAQLRVVHVLAGRLHRAEERGLREAPRWLGLLADRLDRDGLDRLALVELRQELIAARVVVGLVGALRLLAVDRLPAGLEQAPAARAELVLGHDRLDARALVDGLRVEDREEALRDEVVDLQLVGTHLRQVVLGLRRYQRVVVVDLLVVHDAAEWQPVEREHIFRRAPVLGVVAHEPCGRLDLRDLVARQEARVGPRVGDRLVLLVELLSSAQRAPGGEAEQRVGVALERGEVVQELDALALLLLVDLRDLAGVALDLADDLRGVVLGDALAALVATAVAARAARLEGGLHEPVGLRLEGADLLLAARDQRQRRRLHAAERHGAVERAPEPDRCRARGVHAHDPVGLRARPRRGLERAHLLAVAQAAERLLDRLARHRVEPEPLDRLLDARGLEQVREDKLALAARVAGVHDQVDVVSLDQLVNGLELLARALVVRDQLELLGQDRKIGEAPLLQLRVVLVGRGESHQVADSPRDHVLVALEVALVLRLLEGAGQRGSEVAADRRLLSYDEGLAHAVSA